MSISIKLVAPDFDSPLIDTLLELDHLRRRQPGGSTPPWLFFQIRDLFHMLESISSARIEGNRTTIAEYADEKIARRERSSEKLLEIANVEEAIRFVEDSIVENADITHHFIRQLHQLVVRGLTEEGDKTPGAYRTWNISIAGADHTPVDSHLVQDYMDALLEFINRQDANKYDLLKSAVAHHRFVWIHPFGNGNGRVVRLLNHALLIKYGFNVKDKILNPAAVFCADRDKYYQMLAQADAGADAAMLEWCRYVLEGILTEIRKIDKLLDFDYLYSNILTKTLRQSSARGHVGKEEVAVLSLAIMKGAFKMTDIDDKILPDYNIRQRRHLLARMKSAGLIKPMQKGSHTYYANFINNFLMRSLIAVLAEEGFISLRD